MLRQLFAAAALAAIAANLAWGQAPASTFSATSAEMEKIQAPRPLRLALKHAAEAKTENDAAKLCTALGTLMEGVATTDYLVDDLRPRKSAAVNPPAANPQPKPPTPQPPIPRLPTNTPTATRSVERIPLLSMRSRIETLVEQLTASERTAFEALWGAKASVALDRALETMDVNEIERVAHRWRYTKGGQDAAMLVARMRLDQGRHAEAMGMLHGLRRFPHVRQRFEPELSQLLISATWMQGRRQAAAELVRVIARDEKWVRQRTEGAWRQIFALDGLAGSEEKTIAALTAELGESKVFAGVLRNAWPMFLGGPNRTQDGQLQSTPEIKAWKDNISMHASLRQQIQTQQTSNLTSGVPMLPATYPTIVNNKLFVRNPERIVAYDLPSGRDLWSYPFDYKTQTPTPQPPQRNVIRIQAFGAGRQVVMPGSDALSRVWGNQTYGQLTATGRYLFAIDGGFDLPTSQQQQVMMFNARGMQFPGRRGANLPPIHNRLIALDLKRDGAVTWVVGGKSGEMNPDLAGAFFLGAPLPEHDRLYVLFEKKGVVRLAVLDANTGATQWTLNLAPILSGVNVDLRRRMLGAAPSLSNGVLICPTTVGGLVAIDTVRRQFLWGWAPKRPTSPANRFQARIVQVSNQGGWTDRPVLMAGDKILHTTDPDFLYCLDRETGQALWRRPRQDAWFVAGAAKGVVLLVGRHRYLGISLADGKPAWPDLPFRAIPAGGSPTGRGFVDGDSYLLPTSEGSPGETAELLRIELKTGKPTRLTLTNRLGNLATNGQWIASAGPDGVELLSDVKLKPTTANKPVKMVDWAALSVAQLVGFLGSDSFEHRQQATKQLQRRKPVEAIDSLAGLALGEDPDAAQRAGSILVALQNDGVADEALEKAITQLADAKNGVAVVLPDANRLRKRAIAKLMSFGAGVQRDGEQVILSAWRGKPEDLKLLHSLPRVQHLLIYNEARVDEMLPHVSGLKDLQILTLQQCKLTDEGLAKLKDLPVLRHLELRGAKITDASIDKLGQFKALRILGVSNTKLTKRGGEKLQKLLPNARITGLP